MKIVSVHKALLLSVAFASCPVFAQQIATQPGGAPPAGLNASVTALLEKQGAKVIKDGQPLAELWYRAQVPSGAASNEANLTMPNVPHGALLGAIKFDQQHNDRRGQTIKPGVYTLRYSYFPENGAHQGAAPQRDFLLLVPAAADTEGASNPNFEQLVGLSTKASGTSHPNVLSIWKEDASLFKENTVEQQGEMDWVLMRKMGEVPVSLIVAGAAAH